VSRLATLCKRAVALGIDGPIADVVESYLEQAEASADAYRDFHWGEDSEGGQLLELPPPPLVLVEIGPLVAVVYEATKGGEFAHWEHGFSEGRPEDRPMLAFDEMADGQLYVLGGTYTVTPAGIVG
jgi:hypothetical protein